MWKFLAITLLVSPLSYVFSADDASLRMQVEQSLEIFHLDEATALIPQLQKPGYRVFYENTVLVYRYFADQNPAHLQKIRADWKNTLQYLEALPAEDTLKLIMLAEVQCKRAILEFFDQNYLTAVRHARLGRTLIKENQQRFPKNINQKKVLGLFNVVFGAVPTKYQWITNSLGYKGNMQTGMAQLQDCANSGNLLRLESTLILYNVERNILGLDTQASERLEKERKRFDKNILLDFFLASGYQSIKQNEKALQILTQRDQYADGKVCFITFWDYLLGRAYYYKSNNREAQRYLSRFIKTLKGNIFRSDALFRLGMALTLDGSYPVGRHFFQVVANEKTSGFDEDEYAIFMAGKFLNQAPGPNLNALFRARNLFDGGYLEESLAILTQLEPRALSLTVPERTELYYRFGRIYHSMGKLPEALVRYNKCATQPVSDQLWMQVYSFYYQAEIARSTNNYALARTHYQKALTYNDYFYQAGLESRCKAALDEINGK
ncbi:MAG: tetratricopeptide repeat protein [Bacteroidia bacterium]|nr:tetratricopeptide repeat protein [Bacteroidia bacterium]